MTTKRLLTEAEILKMSDKDYMNEDQLAFFKNKLEQLQADILRNAGQTTENLRETVIVPGNDRGRACARTAHARPRAQAAEEGSAVDRAYRLGRLRLVRRNR
jgi:DnaK suppressor protein